VEEAIDYQILVGPSGEIVRRRRGRAAAAPADRTELGALMKAHRRADGSVWMPSSTWAIMARKT